MGGHRRQRRARAAGRKGAAAAVAARGKRVLREREALLTASAEQDKLEHALQARPKPEELVKEGILKGKQRFRGCCYRSNIKMRRAEDEIPPA